ncbi:MAG TPA: GNAT family N-acetyltransferase, partial [Acidimicrobiia bacterium]|nr:GNAT family N-acetyltransferase [Acidimicrobiia bacterium]
MSSVEPPPAADEVLETGWLPSTPVDDSVTRRFVLGFAEWVESCGNAAGHPVLRTPDVVAVDEHSAQLLLNTAILLRPVTPERAPQVVADLVGFYGGKPGGPFCVFCPWPTALPDLAVGGSPPVMFRAAGVPERAAAPGLDVREVSSLELLEEYERVLVEGFPLDDVPAGEVGAALHPSTLHVPGMRMFVGLADGRGVTGATSIVAHGVNHVEWVATLADARGKGFGEEITWAATLAEPTVPAMLIASDMGRPVYERMGYVVLDRWTFLVGTR